MKAATLKALVWKDFRISIKVLIFGIVTLTSPYLIILIAAIFGDGYPNQMRPWSIVAEGASLSLWYSYLLIVVLIDNVITAECLDRSAGFLAYLPPSNAEILTSKSILLFVPCVLCPVLTFLLTHVGDRPPTIGPFGVAAVPNVMTFSALTVLIIGGTWLMGLVRCTCGRRGRVICVIIMPVVFILAGFVMVHGNAKNEMIRQWLSFLALAVGLICFALGWLYGLRRWRATS